MDEQDGGTSKIYANVDLGDGVQLGDFCVIGQPPRGRQGGELSTTSGRGA